MLAEIFRCITEGKKRNPTAIGINNYCRQSIWEAILGNSDTEVLVISSTAADGAGK